MIYLHEKNILSKMQCNEMIEKALTAGFEPAQVNVYGQQATLNHIRNNTRLEFDDNKLAHDLKEKLVTTLGSSFPHIYEGKKFIKVNSHFRMYCYRPGEYFKPHKDGGYKDDNLSSLITVLFYLNDTLGGETVIMPNGFKDKESYITILPQEGSALLFNHDVFHEGKPVTSGEKYVLRTDLFYTQS